MQRNSPQRHGVHEVNLEIVPTYFNKSFVKFALLVSLLCVLCASTVNLHAQDFKTIHDGVEYAEGIRKLGDDPVKINLLRLDLKKVRLDVQHAMDAAIGTEKTSSIAIRKGAVAAINGGFFRLDNSKFAGEAAGVLMIDGVLLSESTNDRIAVVIQNSKRYTSVFFNRVRAYGDVHIGDGDNGFHHFDLSGVNRERKDNEAILFTPFFGASTRTEARGTEISLRRCKDGKLRGSFRDIVCRRTDRKDGSGNAVIPRDGLVISFGPEFSSPDDVVRSRLERLGKPGSKDIKIRIINPILLDGGAFTVDKTVDITNGIPLLIRNSKIDITWEKEKASKSFVETRHPRTAVAKLKDGKFLMITVDGRQPGVSVGMNLNELAEYLLGLGAVDAMNLDGGGSTTMFLDGKVVNKPSDKEGERKVSDAILVKLRKKK